MANDDLAVSLAILRNIRRWSQSELAEAAKVTNSAISDYERGKVDPQSATLQRMLRAFGLPLSALDQTLAFIYMIRSQMAVGETPAGADAGAPAARTGGPLTPRDHEMQLEIAQVASEGGRFASRLTRLLLQVMGARGE